MLKRMDKREKLEAAHRAWGVAGVYERGEKPAEVAGEQAQGVATESLTLAPSTEKARAVNDRSMRIYREQQALTGSAEPAVKANHAAESRELEELRWRDEQAARQKGYDAAFLVGPAMTAWIRRQRSSPSPADIGAMLGAALGTLSALSEARRSGPTEAAKAGLVHGTLGMMSGALIGVAYECSGMGKVSVPHELPPEVLGELLLKASDADSRRIEGWKSIWFSLSFRDHGA